MYLYWPLRAHLVWEREHSPQQARVRESQARLPDSLYRWEWQNARLYRARWEAGKEKVNLDASIRFYAAATQPVQFIRNDTPYLYSNLNVAFLLPNTYKLSYFSIFPTIHRFLSVQFALI